MRLGKNPCLKSSGKADNLSQSMSAWCIGKNNENNRFNKDKNKLVYVFITPLRVLLFITEFRCV